MPIKTNETIKAIFQGNSIARRLATAVILFSSLFTVMITALQLYIEYQRDMTTIESNFEAIEASQLSLMANSVWSLNRNQIQTQLDGILQLPDIERATITAEGAILLSSGESTSERIKSNQYNIVHVRNGEDIIIGKLEVIASLDNVYARLTQKLVTLLLSNALKTFFVAIFMLIMFQLLVTKYLYKIADYAENIDISSLQEPDLDLGRSKKIRQKHDALEIVANAVNKMREGMRSSYRKVRASEAKLEKALEISEKTSSVKSKFLASMSHEIRTPLNAIIGFAEVLEMGVGAENKEKRNESLRIIASAGRQLNNLLADILDFSKMEAGKLEYNLEVTDPYAVISDNIPIIEHLAEEKDIEFHCTNTCGQLIFVDSSRLSQIMLNFISNAVKYNKPNGEIEFGCTNMPDDRLKIYIKDSGIGIPCDQQDIIFLPFERIEQMGHIAPGVGIGLSICKEITEQMGGEIGFESMLGEGSTFWVQFPIIKA